MEIQEQLKHEAINLGLCKQWQSEWGHPDTKELCNKFIRGIDFCIKHDWPSVDEIKRIVDIDEIAAYGVYVKDGKSHNQPNVVVMGDAVVDIYVGDYQVCDIYSRHNSTVRLHIGKFAFAYVTMLNDCKVTVVDKHDTAKLKASHFSGTFINQDKFDAIHYKG